MKKISLPLNHIIKNSQSSITDMLLYSYFVFKPFYLFPSGKPQIADFILCLLFVSLILNKYDSNLNNNVNLHNKIGIFITMIVFVMYTLLINTIWAIYLGGITEMMMPIIYYIFNCLSIFTIILYYKHFGAKLFEIIHSSIRTSLAVMSVFIPLGIKSIISGGMRTAIGFNNPNQLGYYSLIILSALLILPKPSKKSKEWLWITICIILIALSLSKAAIYSCIIILLIFIISKSRNHEQRSTKRWFSLLSIMMVISFVIAPELFKSNRIFFNIWFRINYIQNDDNLLFGRGYYRLTEGLQNIIWGNGEGALFRYETLANHEIHSTYASVLMCYGIIGCILFAAILWVAFFKGGGFFKTQGYLFCGILLYWITHNGIRNTLFWVLISVYAIYRVEQQTNLNKGYINLSSSTDSC